jgi:hypothetical protein
MVVVLCSPPLEVITGAPLVTKKERRRHRLVLLLPLRRHWLVLLLPLRRCSPLIKIQKNSENTVRFRVL